MSKAITAFSEKHKWIYEPLGLTFPCMISVIGRPNSGKTYFTLDLLSKIKNNFDEIIIYLGAKDTAPEFLKLVNKETKKPVVKVLFKYSENDLRTFYKKLEDRQLKLVDQKKKPINLLFVFDDILGFHGLMNMSRNKPSMIQELSANYRHVNASMIITAQNYMKLIPEMRCLNVTYLILCSVAVSDKKKIAEEHETSQHDKKIIPHIFDEIREDIGHLTLIDNHSKREDDKFKHIYPDGHLEIFTV
jgi:hypothetical protein